LYEENPPSICTNRLHSDLRSQPSQTGMETETETETEKETVQRSALGATPPLGESPVTFTTIAPTRLLNGTCLARGFIDVLRTHQSHTLPACEAACTWDNTTGGGGGAGHRLAAKLGQTIIAILLLITDTPCVLIRFTSCGTGVAVHRFGASSRERVGKVGG